MSLIKNLLLKALKNTGVPTEPELWDIDHLKLICKQNNIDPDKIINENKKKRDK